MWSRGVRASLFASLFQALLGLSVATTAAGCGGPGRDDIVVLAAASLTDVLSEAGTGFENARGTRVSFSYGGSDMLAGQVRDGAPADAVIFAGSHPMDGLQSDGLVIAASRRNVASNRLVVVARAGSGASLPSLEGLEIGNSGKVAIADPQLAPAGRYARLALENAGVWATVQPRLIPGLDVRNAAAAVTSGNALFGIVYETDAAAIGGLEVVLVVPANLYPPIVYPAAVVTASRNADAAGEFLSYLTSADALAIFGRHGFLPPP